MINLQAYRALSGTLLLYLHLLNFAMKIMFFGYL